MEEISQIRRLIDECDKELVDLFQHRMKLVMEVLDIKKNNFLPILDLQREDEIVRNALANIKEENLSSEIETFIKEILKISRSIQSKKLFPYNIVLIGFMGTGKSTVGRDLSRKLNLGYIDTDTMIQERKGMIIKEIFDRYGEGFFREIEKEVISEVSKMKNKIILCGGGVVLNPINIENLRSNGRLILLKAQPETILKRIDEDDTRPVLRGYFSIEGVKALMQERNHLYNKAADIVIETDDKPVDEISSDIIRQLYSMD